MSSPLAVWRYLDVPLRWALYGVVRWIPPRGRGLRLVQIVDDHAPATDRLYTTHIFGASIACDLRDPVQQCIFYRGIYEPEMSEVLTNELRKGDAFLDIGANVGYFSLLAARAVGPTGTVIAFEPASDTRYRLRLAAESQSQHNDVGHIQVEAVALSDRSGKAVLSRVADNKSGERYISSEGPGEEVQTTSLMGLFPDVRPQVVKIDVEGAELRVLEGMERILRAAPPRLILVEVIEDQLSRFGDSADELHDFMTDVGYRGEIISSPYFAPMVAFRPSKRAPIAS